jgi:hypothetical protein
MQPPTRSSTANERVKVAKKSSGTEFNSITDGFALFQTQEYTSFTFELLEEGVSE